MPVFIDPPMWPAHGTFFSHLISNSSLAELHEFAASAGIPVKAFDRDHYDVPQHRHQDLIDQGAQAVDGGQLTRVLLASGLRVPARARNESLETALQLRWEATVPGHAGIGRELLTRWAEPQRHYHSRTHLLAVLEAISILEASPPRAVVLAAWFHDAVYQGLPGRDEEDSARLAETVLAGVVPVEEIRETARLVRLTIEHNPGPNDHNGALLCDSDLSILGSSEAEYARYLAAVRQDYAHVSDHDFANGRATVVRELLALDPLFKLPQAQRLWLEKAQRNLQSELY